MDLWSQPCILAPSLICLDMCNLEQQANRLKENGIEVLHVDILDGHFSPSMPLGLDTVRQLREKTDLAFDCHVMATSNDYFIDELLDIGVQQIVFHVENENHIDGMLNRIRSKGVRAGVALKPSTSLSYLDFILEKCDQVLLMLINPGYAFVKGEQQVNYADKKIMMLRQMINDQGTQTKISIDGRISTDNIRTYGQNTVDSFVVGSTCIKRDRLSESLVNLQKLRTEIINSAL